MPRYSNPHDIQPVPGELLRFTMRSRSTNGRQLIDLEEHKFNGWCSCTGFSVGWNGKKQWREKVKQNGPSDETRCFHIREVRKWFLDRDVLPIIAAHMRIRKNQIR